MTSDIADSPDKPLESAERKQADQADAKLSDETRQGSDNRQVMKLEQDRMAFASQDHLPGLELTGDIGAAGGAQKLDAPAAPADGGKPVDQKAVEQAVKDIDAASDHLGGHWTSTSEINKVFEGKSKSERDAIAKEYEKEKGISLDSHLKDKLSGDDLNQSMHLLHRTDLEKSADEVHNAIGLRNDPEAINKALEGKSVAQIKQMNDYFKDTYGYDLDTFLTKNMYIASEREHALALLHPKEEVAQAAGARGDIPVGGAPSPTDKPVDPKVVEQAVKDIDAAKKWSGVDADAIDTVLQGKSKAERDAIAEAYEKAHKVSLDQYLQDKLSGEDLRKAMHLLHRSDAEKGADEITEAMGTFRNETGDIYNALRGKTPAQILEMDQYFKKTYGSGLEDYLKDNMYIGFERDHALALLHPDVTKKSEQLTQDEAVKQIETATHFSDVDSRAINNALEGKSKAERDAIAKQFEAETGTNLDKVLEKKLSGAELEKSKHLLDRSDLEMSADGLHDAIGMFRNDDAKINMALDNRSPEELKEMNEYFKKRYGVGLKEFLDHSVAMPSERDHVFQILSVLDPPAPAKQKKPQSQKH